MKNIFKPLNPILNYKKLYLISCNMDFNYLKEIRNLYETSSSLLEIVFILGNTTCDIDSALSAYMLSIGKNLKCGTINLSKKGKPSVNDKTTTLY